MINISTKKYSPAVERAYLQLPFPQTSLTIKYYTVFENNIILFFGRFSPVNIDAFKTNFVCVFKVHILIILYSISSKPT